MEAKLVVAKGRTSVKEIPLGGVSTIIGRRNDCTLRIPSPLVSRQHCELTRTESRLIVKDLNSSNGTFVNGSKIRQKELRTGDTLGVGPVTFIVQLGGARLSPSDTARPHLAAALAEDDEFVIAEELDADQASEFVPAQDGAADEGADADFVVSEEITAEPVEEDSDFVVAEEVEPATEVAPVDEFVVADEAAPAAEVAEVADFAVADEDVAEAETIYDADTADATDALKRTAAAAPDETDAAEEATGVAGRPKKKPGLFGRLFKRKQKAESAPPPQPADAATAAKKKGIAKSSPPTAVPVKPAPAETPAAPDDIPDFFAADDEGPPAPAKSVGEDELADFLIELNKKEE